MGSKVSEDIGKATTATISDNSSNRTDERLERFYFDRM
jgi:hypothetical protein